jgi:hypothetical protein
VQERLGFVDRSVLPLQLFAAGGDGDELLLDL